MSFAQKSLPKNRFAQKQSRAFQIYEKTKERAKARADMMEKQAFEKYNRISQELKKRYPEEHQEYEDWRMGTGRFAKPSLPTASERSDVDPLRPYIVKADYVFPPNQRFDNLPSRIALNLLTGHPLVDINGGTMEGHGPSYKELAEYAQEHNGTLGGEITDHSIFFDTINLPTQA